MIRQLYVLIGVLVVCLPMAIGQTSASAKKRQTLLLLKVLSYDYFLGKRHKGVVHIGLLHLPSHAGSLRRAKEMLRTMTGLKMTVAGRAVRASLLPYKTFETAKAKGIGTVFVCEGLSKEQLGKVTSFAAKAKVLTFGGSRAQVLQGVAAAIVPQGEHIKILINRRATANQGSKFSGRLLRLAEVVDK